MISRLSLTLWMFLAAAATGLGAGSAPAAAQQEPDQQPAAEQQDTEQQQAPFGVWMPEDKESKVEIFPCGDAMCGRVAWMLDGLDDEGKPLTDIYNPNPALRSSPVLGLIIMTDIRPTEEDNVWQGRVYNPQDGRTYDFWLTKKSDSQITIQGCGLYNLICQTHTWDRVDPVTGDLGDGQQ